MADAETFINLVAGLPEVDVAHLGVIGVSMGAAKVALAAYPHQKVKLCIMLAGPFDLVLTKNRMTSLSHLVFRVTGCKLNGSDAELTTHSPMQHFRPEGIVLEGDTLPTPNQDRVFLMASKDDPMVSFENTLEAVRRLNLPPANYRVFARGGHNHDGNEWDIATMIAMAVTSRLAL